MDNMDSESTQAKEHVYSASGITEEMLKKANTIAGIMEEQNAVVQQIASASSDLANLAEELIQESGKFKF